MKRFLTFVTAMTLCVMVSACSFHNAAVDAADGNVTVQEDPAAGFLGNLSRFTQADVEQASDLAGDSVINATNLPGHDGIVDGCVDNLSCTHGDGVAAMCYSFLDAKLMEAPKGTVVAGIVSAFQAGRNLKRGLVNGAADGFDIACGPLVTQVRRDILKLVAKVGVKGILPF